MINSGYDIGGVALSRTRRRTGFGVDTRLFVFVFRDHTPFCLLSTVFDGRSWTLELDRCLLDTSTTTRWPSIH